MGIFWKLFNWSSKKSTSEWNFYPLTNTSYDVKNLSRNDYLWLYTGRAFACVSITANAVAQLEQSLTRSINSNNQIDHKYRNLITYDLLMKMVSHLQITGSTFVWKHKIGNSVNSLEVIRPDLVTIERNGDWSTRNYLYNSWYGNYKLYRDDLIIIHNYNPYETYPIETKGISPMSAVAIQMESDVTTNRYNRNFFKNNGSLRDIITADKPITQENKERIISSWRSKYTGVNNAHKIAVLDNGLKYMNVSPTQKEMDFVESRRFTRDEVFAIFKVHKIMVWVTEWVNRATAQTAEQIFSKYTIQPIAIQIEEALNRDLFQGAGIFSFINIVPKDTEQLASDLNNGAITINEYRAERGYESIKDGDVLKLNSFATSNAGTNATEDKKEVKNPMWEIVRKSFLSNIKGTEERWEKIRRAKIKRTDQYEVKYIDAIKKIRQEQQNDLIEQITKWKKERKGTKYLTMWLASIGPLQKEVFLNEWNQSLAMIGLESGFQIWSSAINGRLNDNIKKFAKEVDLKTKEDMLKVIAEWNEAGISAPEIAKNISAKFEEFGSKRALTIARTEIVRASNEASIVAWEQSGVVEGKKRYTANDERVCEFCWPMNWKTLWLREDFYKKWEVLQWEKTSLKLDYETIGKPSLHPNCRCTLLPIV